MQLTGTTGATHQIITVHENRIDAAVALQFKETMRTLIEDGVGDIILDLSQVQFIDSSGLGAIVAAMKTLGADRRMTLAGLTPTVDKVFRLTRMDSVFRICPTLDDALEPQ